MVRIFCFYIIWIWSTYVHILLDKIFQVQGCYQVKLQPTKAFANSGAGQFIFSVLSLINFSYRLDSSASEFLLNFKFTTLIRHLWAGGHSNKYPTVANACTLARMQQVRLTPVRSALSSPSAFSSSSAFRNPALIAQ